jgi:hypothetical protein
MSRSFNRRREFISLLAGRRHRGNRQHVVYDSSGRFKSLHGGPHNPTVRHIDATVMTGPSTTH